MSRLSDVTHYGARLLKRRLEKHDRWQEFCGRVGQTKSQTGQTEVAFLTPPAQRSKARFMNLGPLLSWAEKTLAVLDQQPASVLQHSMSERLEEKFGWLREYRQVLATWQEYEAISQAVFEVVREERYGHGVSGLAAERSRGQVQSDADEILQSELLTFVSQQPSLVPEGSRLPGSTEVLESRFGKFKSLEGDQQKGGFTSLKLSCAALLRETTTALIATAIKSTPWKRVQWWYRAHLGLTVQGKRVIAHQSVTAESAQQNPEEP